ncbi:MULTISPECIES: hypothetical protein [Paenibacillus]|uniref:Uncharacterized protein n=1 Tax=Paenibacillus alvei TaxID=44250 RepID=A0ABT4EDZ3_PAEAL|nr:MULTISPECIES: hypothetical protein [Paenibacillus]EPY10881.1 hypothetical protein PAAL66ix_21562 [Paenibacillus alvei A6-6i-x]MCY9531962.1 hypothetical protein [Paenibacillus alvei]SDF29232.1 hypothetical protein SAMN04488689_104219 [Paenibacillus sp. cl6col]
MTTSKSKKPVYKRWWFILLVVLIIVPAAIGAALDDGKKNVASVSTVSTNTSNSVDEGDKKDMTKDINVELSVKENVAAGKVSLTGTTNLPDGTGLMITVSNENGFRAQSSAVVISNEFMTEEFSYNGQALESGAYNVDVTMPIASVQPDAVKKIIGENSENLKGDLVKEGDLGKTVNYSKSIIVEEASKVDHSAMIKEYKNKIIGSYKTIKDTYGSHSKSLDAVEWAKFAREFKENVSNLRNEIEESKLNQSDKIVLSPACADLEMLLTAYAASLQGRDDDTEIKRLKTQIEEAIK